MKQVLMTWLLGWVCVAAAAAPRDEVAAVLDTFHTAAATADLERYEAQMTADMVFLGTDASERWQGQGFIDFARPYFESGKGWTYRVRSRRVQVDTSAGVAWFDETLDNDKLGLCRGSGVLLRQDGGWKIAQYNLSMPVPNAMIEKVAREIQAGDGAEITAPPETVEASVSGQAKAPCRKRHKTNTRADC